jgi:prophage antirepressor-like protein
MENIDNITNEEQKVYGKQEITMYNHESFGEVRVVTRDGEPWFVAVDVCRALGLEPNATRRLDDDEKITLRLTQGDSNRTSDTNVVNEPGLYSLVLGSRKPEAKAFKRWITHDIIPAIRKNGMYATPMTVEKMIEDPDYAISLLQRVKDERLKRMEAERARAEAERQRNILIHVQKTFTSTEIAKELGMKSARELNNWLCSSGVQYKQNGTWVLYSKYADLGYTEIKQQALDNGHVVYDRRWTNDGRSFILNLAKGEE